MLCNPSPEGRRTPSAPGRSGRSNRPRSAKERVSARRAVRSAQTKLRVSARRAVRSALTNPAPLPPLAVDQLAAGRRLHPSPEAQLADALDLADAARIVHREGLSSGPARAGARGGTVTISTVAVVRHPWRPATGDRSGRAGPPAEWRPSRSGPKDPICKCRLEPLVVRGTA